jgi:nitrate reductase delta subunit
MSLWSGQDPDARGPGSARKGEPHLDAVERLKDWTRGRFVLVAEETVLVSESATTLPGYPPTQTLVAFWTLDGTRHHFKVFKPVEEVVEDDLPPPWLKASLAYSEGMSCSCC